MVAIVASLPPLWTSVGVASGKDKSERRVLPHSVFLVNALTDNILRGFGAGYVSK